MQNNKLRSFKSIGDELGISENDARKIYHDGMEKLRVLLREQPDRAAEWWDIMDELDTATFTKLQDIKIPTVEVGVDG